MMKDGFIVCQNLHKSYEGLKAVDGVSFSIKKGEIFGLLGPNGAGKTTIVECLQGLRSPDAGYVRILGLDPQTEKQAVRQHIGSQLQQSALPDRIKVWEALDLFSSFTRGQRDWRVLMDQWGLAGKKDSAFGSLSGGQRQRLFIALALVNNPSIVFLDEMTTGLDPTARKMAWDLVRQVQKNGTTVVLVTHFMEEAENLCDRVAILNHGKIVALNSPQGLINAYSRQIKVIFSTESLDIGWMETIPHVHRVFIQGARVEIEGDGPVLGQVAAALINRDIFPADLHVQQPTLEDVFLTITGQSMQS
jgi:ABC-2 type transport system ATP-binding protein